MCMGLSLRLTRHIRAAISMHCIVGLWTEMNEEIKDLFSSSIVIHYVTNIDKNLHQVFQLRLEFMLGLGRGIEGDVSQSPTKLELQKRNTFSAPNFSKPHKVAQARPRQKPQA